MKASETLRRLVESAWDAAMERSPVAATAVGDHRFNDRLPDLSPDAHAEWLSRVEEFREKLEEIPAKALNGEDCITRRVFEWWLEEERAAYTHRAWQMDLDPMAGPHLLPHMLTSIHPLDSEEHIEQLAARWRAFPKCLEGWTASLREGVASGRVCFAGVVDRVLGQVRRMAGTPPEQWAIWAALPSDTSASLRDRLAEAARDAVIPAWRALEAFLSEEYRPQARTAPGLCAIPDGAAMYGWLVRHHTTLDVSAERVHRIGGEELARLEDGFRALARRMRHAGDVPSFIERVRSDPGNRFSSREEILKAFRDALAALEARVGALFGRLPKARCEVLPVEEYREQDSPAAFYQRPTDPESRGSVRPGQFRINTSRPETRVRYNVMALTAHETVPGHHFQVAIAQELEGLPRLRRLGGTTAYVEGWAHYAELLADELGMYEDDLQRFGMISEQAWRAARLVVDTGIHAFGWERERAIEFMLSHVALTRHECEVEVDRYIAWPGQALAYTIGRRCFQDLRARAGGDVRAYHDEVLGHGALPLAVLEEVVGRVMAAQRS